MTTKKAIRNPKRDTQNSTLSVSPNGESFPLPRPEDYEKELARLKSLVAAQRKKKREIVVVMGVGFVGAVMAGVVADSVDKKTGKPNKFVIGMQRPSSRSFWKIPYLNRGVAPVESEDPEVAPLIARCVNEKKTLIATFTYDALSLADVVVVDVQCDYFKEALGNCRQGHAEIAALEDSLKVIGEKINPDCLVLIETTVPPGTTEYVAYPIMKKAFENRGIMSDPLLAHSYERVMPGREYVASIRDFWRVCSGINDTARERVRTFLTEILNVEKFPLTVLDRPIESETCKIVENSYRATILAFLNEWSLFAERNGVDLIKVIQAIKVRPTHSNMIFPGPGIGGYCLPKDGGLRRLVVPDSDGLRRRHLQDHTAGDRHQRHTLPPRGRTRPGRPAEHGEDRCRFQGGYSGRLLPRGRGRHPLQRLRGPCEKTDGNGRRDRRPRPLRQALVGVGEAGDIPCPGHSWARFFRNQDKLTETRIQPDLKEALKGADAVVLAVRHQAYLKLDPDKVIKMTGRPVAIIDCFGILNDAQIRPVLRTRLRGEGPRPGSCKKNKGRGEEQLMLLRQKAYYTVKFLVPRPLQIRLRRYFIQRKRFKYADVWPIDRMHATPRKDGPAGRRGKNSRSS